MWAISAGHFRRIVQSCLVGLSLRCAAGHQPPGFICRCLLLRFGFCRGESRALIPEAVRVLPVLLGGSSLKLFLKVPRAYQQGRGQLPASACAGSAGPRSDRRAGSGKLPAAADRCARPDTFIIRRAAIRCCAWCMSCTWCISIRQQARALIPGSCARCAGSGISEAGEGTGGRRAAARLSLRRIGAGPFLLNKHLVH